MTVTPSDVDHVENAEFLAAALNEFQAGELESQVRQTELDATRAQLEDPGDPGTADGANEATFATAVDPDAHPGFPMTADRRVGTIELEIPDGTGADETAVRFGQPSGRASISLLEPIDELEREGGSVLDLGEYVWGTLGAWCLDPEKDADWWADETALLDAIGVTRSLALGGNVPNG